MQIFFTFDVEPDLHSGMHKSLEIGLPRSLQVLNKYNIKATFFVPALLLQQFPNYFKKLEKQGHEIAIHGYKHERFDNLSKQEKEFRIIKSIQIYKSILKKNPKGFRAPQHSIDNQTLIILEQNNFLYDSSYTPFNFLQLLFFPKKFRFWLNGIFTPRKIYKIKSNLYELPISSFLIPFVSLPLRIFPWPIIKLYLNLLKLTNQNLIFYAHSWDFIRLSQSKIDTIFRYTNLLKNFERTIFYLSKNKSNRFLTMAQMIAE